MALADLLPMSYVEIGKIKIGRKKPRNEKGWCPPEKLDHFLITTLHRGGDDNLIVDQALMDSLKDYADKDGKLRSIPVMFGSNDIEDVLVTSYTWYIGKTCGARTDGKTITFYADPKTGRLLDEPLRYKWHPSYLDFPDPASRQPKPMLKRFSTLNCMIASPNAKFGGFYRFRTTSEISSRQLYGSLMHFCGMNGLCPGVLRGLPFRLVVRPMQVSPVVNGNPVSSTVHVVHVEYMHSDLKALQSAAAEQRKLEFEGFQMMLESDTKYKMLVAAQKANPELDDEDLVDEPKEEALGVLQLGAKGPDRAQQKEQEQAAVLEAIDKGIAACTTPAALLAFWESNIRPPQFWGKLDQQQRDDVTVVWKKKDAELKNPPAAKPDPVQEAESVPDAEFTDAGGPPAEEGPEEAGPQNPGGKPAPEAPKDATAPAPLKAGKTILDSIKKALGQRTYAQVRATSAIALPEKPEDLTADQALKLLESLRAEGGGK